MCTIPPEPPLVNKVNSKSVAPVGRKKIIVDTRGTSNDCATSNGVIARLVLLAAAGQIKQNCWHHQIVLLLAFCLDGSLMKLHVHLRCSVYPAAATHLWLWRDGLSTTCKSCMPPILCVAQTKSAIKKFSILIKMRRSTTSSSPP